MQSFLGKVLKMKLCLIVALFIAGSVTTSNGCTQTVLCIKGNYFDQTKCKCVPCTEMQVCPARFQWNVEQCKCVCAIKAKCLSGYTFCNETCTCIAGSPTTTNGCVQNVVCIKTDYFDHTKCKCVPCTEKQVCPDRFQWNVEQCKCVCAIKAKCPSGYAFSNETCKCFGPIISK